MELLNKKHDTHNGYEYVIFEWERGIMRGINGYVKIPDNHPQLLKLKKLRWSKWGDRPRSYRYDYEAVDVNVHGGLTFGEKITKKNIKNWFQPFTIGWWVGWDYMHAGDEMYITKERAAEKDDKVQNVYADIMAIHNRFPGLPKDKVWKMEEVEEHCKGVIKQLQKLQKNGKN